MANKAFNELQMTVFLRVVINHKQGPSHLLITYFIAVKNLMEWLKENAGMVWMVAGEGEHEKYSSCFIHLKWEVKTQEKENTCKWDFKKMTDETWWKLQIHPLQHRVCSQVTREKGRGKKILARSKERAEKTKEKKPTAGKESLWPWRVLPYAPCCPITRIVSLSSCTVSDTFPAQSFIQNNDFQRRGKSTLTLPSPASSRQPTKNNQEVSSVSWRISVSL